MNAKAATVNTSDLTTRAMLASLTIKVPKTSKKDKDASEEVIHSHLAKEGAARVHKDLFPKDYVAGFKSAAREARAAFYEGTLPWGAGARILLSANYFKLVERIERIERNFWSEAEKFKQKYEEGIEEARKELGSLFRDDDYATAEEMWDRFEFQLNFAQLTDAADWRVKLGAHEEARIKKQVERTLQERMEEASKEPWKRLKEVLDAMVERLSDPKKKFFSTLVTNVEDLCDAIPGLNIAGDPELESLVNEVRARLTIHTPDELRKNLDTRQETAEQAARLVDRVNEYAGLI